MISTLSEQLDGLSGPPNLNPLDEHRRLEALYSYEILDTHPSREFDELAKIAATLCGAKGALITFIDSDRQWVKGAVGVAACDATVHRDKSFCAHSIPTKSHLVVNDSLADLRFVNNPLVTSGVIRFYAGSPIIDPSGEVLGSVCVFDPDPHKISDDQLSALGMLSRQVMDQIIRERLAQDISGVRGQTEALRLLATGVGLSEVLSTLTRGYDLSEPESWCSIMLVRADKLFYEAACGLDEEYLRLTDGSPIGPDEGSCGAAVFTRRPAISENIATDPRWAKYVGIAERFCLRSCWSIPVLDKEDNVMATFAVYHTRETKPDQRKLELLDSYARVAAVAIEGKRQQEALETARDAAETESRFKSEFLANMSHEIRTPLNGIVGMANELALTELSEDQQEAIDTIQGCAKTLLMVINDILDISKIEAGKLTLDRSRGNLRRVVSEVVTAHREAARRNQTELEFEYGAGTPQHYYFDSLRIKQIVGNLLSNAVKFTERGKVSVRVSVVPSGRIQIQISDTGIGISTKNLKTIFNKFTQADASTTREFGGTGLGLAIVKSLLEIKGGTISVESEPGRGSTFTVELPLVRAESTIPDREEASLPETFVGNALLAEDNLVNQRVAQGALKRLGLSVVTVMDGEEALKALATQEFQIILMDIQMPKMDGYETARRIRISHPSLPIIALTAHALTEERARCLEAGMSGHLAKPFTLAELRQAVSPFLSQSGG